ncbi:hypothetical protein PPACK8108_LOCUS14867 [Phakopsora pachyrhizi]|uniref:Uncharacterized protein n=1 Tax=Phakopsora pachyrhizi TaxID=170000 RepID=A0AAV0B8X4_PHAPC|nr:hypothetical protein PPACK8108_LOCUS14867 [Phakopsora pachyrhizi]
MEARAKLVWYWDSRMAHRLQEHLVPGDMVLAYNKSLEDQWGKLFHSRHQGYPTCWRSWMEPRWPGGLQRPTSRGFTHGETGSRTRRKKRGWRSDLLTPCCYKAKTCLGLFHFSLFYLTCLVLHIYVVVYS